MRIGILNRDPKFYERRRRELNKEESEKKRLEELENKTGVRTYKEYEKLVRELTDKQPLYVLENYEKRAFTGHHIDHIISIMYGYKNNIDPEVIADITNLQMIEYAENMKKGHSCYCYIPSCKHLKLIHYLNKINNK